MRSRHLLSVSLLAVAALVCTSAVAAQSSSHFNSDTTLHGVPPSVTSFGFGGNRGFHGMPASVTSPNFGATPLRHHPVFGSGEHHRHNRVVNPFYGGSYYVPYAYPVYVMDPGVDDAMETDYAAPMNSDRTDTRDEVRHELDALRSTVEDYRSELRASRRTQDAYPQQNTEARTYRDIDQKPPADQPKTVLVFRDGHQVEVANYAIVGGMLYDLSEGRTKKVELAELDLQATVKQNDERGVEFQLPAGAKRN